MVGQVVRESPTAHEVPIISQTAKIVVFIAMIFWQMAVH